MSSKKKSLEKTSLQQSKLVFTNDGKLNVSVTSGTWTIQLNYRALGNII